MANITGLITVNGKQILEVDAPPGSGAGTPAPIASLALYDDGVAGSLYIKFGAADTDWRTIDITASWDLVGNTLTGGAPATPNEFFGSVNDFDVLFRRNNIEQMRLVDGALLVGLNASLGGRLQLAGTTQGADILKEVLQDGGNNVIKVTRMYRALTVGAVTTNFDIGIPADTVVQLETRSSVRQTAGASGSVGDGMCFGRTLHAKNVAGTVTLVLEQNDFTSKDPLVAFLLSGMTASVSTTNIRYTLLGAANRNLTWGIHSNLLITGT